jgi:hypothetical protein
MRFLALVRKELRECLPWMLLAGLLLLTVGGWMLRYEAERVQRRLAEPPRLSPGSAVTAAHEFTRPHLLSGPAQWLCLLAPGLGVVLGIRHFWMPLYTRTWSFLLHRSVGRLPIWLAKCGATAIALVVSLGAVWSGLYWYARRPDVFVIPAPARDLIVGWVYVALGLVAYLGTALSALSAARWYTTRIFGLLFAGLATVVIVCQWNLGRVAVLLLLTLFILASQAVATFLDREF